VRRKSVREMVRLCIGKKRLKLKSMNAAVELLGGWIMLLQTVELLEK